MNEVAASPTRPRKNGIISIAIVACWKPVMLSVPESIIVGSLMIAVAMFCAACILAKAIAKSRTTSATSENWLSSIPLPVMEGPTSKAGFPVDPSGIPLRREDRLEIGSTVLSYSQGRWWRAEVVALEPGGRIKIRFPGWDAKWDTTVELTDLQQDVDAGY